MADSQLRTTRRPLFGWIIAALAVAALGWHMHVCRSLDEHARQLKNSKLDDAISVSVNGFSNLVTVRMKSDRNPGDPWSGFGESLGQVFAPGIWENSLNIYARERWDIYAMLIPYCVKLEFTTETASDPAWLAVAESQESPSSGDHRLPPASEAELARVRAKIEESARADQAKRDKAAAVAQYIAEQIVLENPRVAKGSNFGKEVPGVFGTLVNNGNRTLNRVRIRVYFLNSSGKRIGEVEYTPVLVSEISIGDNTPLRPGYRKDFGFSVADDAPSGWADCVEVEVIEIKFDSDG